MGRYHYLEYLDYLFQLWSKFRVWVETFCEQQHKVLYQIWAIDILKLLHSR